MPRSTQTRRRKQQRGGAMTPQQFFDPTVLPPTAGLFAAAPPSAAPTDVMVRPILPATFHQTAGGKRRGHHGGFYPSVMGPFLENASAAVVPAALYMVYHTMVPKNAAKTLGGMWKRARGTGTRKNRRRHAA